MAESNPGTDAGAELYRRFLTGDEAAFTELVTLYRSSLTSYLTGFVNDKREAEELALDTFAELAVSRSFKGKSSLKTYLFAIGRHLALRRARRYTGSACIPLEELAYELAGSEGAGMDGGAALSEGAAMDEGEDLLQEQRARLREALQELRPEYREALYLVYFEDMSYRDAGVAMRKTERQLSNLVYRAKAALRKLLGDEEAGS